MKKPLIYLFIIFASIMNAQIYKDPNASIEDRVNDLLKQMTLDEKIGQMQQGVSYNYDDQLYADIAAGKFGSFLNAGGFAEKDTMQQTAVEKSRLGIPLIFGRDVIHGYKTVFPIPIGQAATWNPELVKQAAAVAAYESAEAGIHWTFAPMVDISRDPRWGRIAESCGEDPYLASEMGAAMIKGFQGNDLSDQKTIAACAKHYVGYGAAESGKDYNTTLIPERELRDIYLKPFKACVDAGAATLMSAFNDLDGIPASGNSFTLKTILRDEWKFNGFVVSDWNSVTEMIPHGFAKDRKEAAMKAVNAGVNMEMVSDSYAKNLKELIYSGAVSESWVNELVKGILRVKFELGLFENPYTRFEKAEKTLSEEFLETAKQSAIESAVLLQNNGMLPLDAANIQRLAVIGPLADSPIDQMGTWVPDGEEKDVITPLKAMQAEYGEKIEITFAKGVENPRATDKSLFDDAVETAEDADVVIVFVGEDYLLSGETHSRAFISLPGVQSELIKEIARTGKPIAVVILSGRPLTFGEITGDVNSILYAWHPGTMGGPAISDLLFGKVSPSGKLPVTFPRTVGQIPLYYNHKNSGRPPSPDQLGRKLGTPENPEGYANYYLDVDFTPAYQFGYGLSYSQFEFSDLNLSEKKIDLKGKLKISVKVTNKGNFEAEEVVQLYIHDLFGSATRPVKELKGFQKIKLKPGEEKNVIFTITPKDLRFYDSDMKYNAEPGDFEVFVGNSSSNDDLLKSKFTIE